MMPSAIIAVDPARTTLQAIINLIVASTARAAIEDGRLVGLQLGRSTSWHANASTPIGTASFASRYKTTWLLGKFDAPRSYIRFSYIRTWQVRQSSSLRARPCPNPFLPMPTEA